MSNSSHRFVEAHTPAARRCCWPTCGAIVRRKFPLCDAHLRVAYDYQTGLLNGSDPTFSLYTEEPQPNRPQPKDSSHGTVYYVQVGAHIKIGWTRDLDKRMRAYPPNSQLLAAQPGTRQDETKMHRRFAAHRTHGREWYAPVPSILHHIEQVKSGHQQPDGVTFGAQPVTIPEPRERQYAARPRTPGPRHIVG